MFPAAPELQQAILDEFGEDVVYTPSGQAARTFRGVFSNSHQELVLETGGSVSTTDPVVALRSADLFPYVPQVNVDEVLVRGRKWLVRDMRDDGEGWLLVFLTYPGRV